MGYTHFDARSGPNGWHPTGVIKTRHVSPHQPSWVFESLWWLTQSVWKFAQKFVAASAGVWFRGGNQRGVGVWFAACTGCFTHVAPQSDYSVLHCNSQITVCCSVWKTYVLQCVVVCGWPICCSVLQCLTDLCVPVCCSVWQTYVLHCVAVSDRPMCCSVLHVWQTYVLHCVAVSDRPMCSSVLQCVTDLCVAVRCSVWQTYVLQCVAVSDRPMCCSVLQCVTDLCVAVCCSVWQTYVLQCIACVTDLCVTVCGWPIYCSVLQCVADLSASHTSLKATTPSSTHHMRDHVIRTESNVCTIT